MSGFLSKKGLLLATFVALSSAELASSTSVPEEPVDAMPVNTMPVPEEPVKKMPVDAMPVNTMPVNTIEECKAGTFLSSETPDECTPCPAGQYSPELLLYCKPCPDGMQPSDDASACICRAGFFSKINGSECLECYYNSYQENAGADKCKECPRGKTSGGGGATTCTNTVCPAGKIKNRDGECQECPVGHFTDEEGKSKCRPCKAGSFANTMGSQKCEKCPDGTTSVMGASACNDETVCKAEGYAMTRDGKCEKCGVGKYSIEGSLDCVPCSMNYYQDAEGSNKCKKCETGFRSTKGSDACIAEEDALMCPAGKKVTVEGKCEDCRPGFYSNEIGALECKPCPFGQYSNRTSSKNCLNCPKGSSPVARATACERIIKKIGEGKVLSVLNQYTVVSTFTEELSAAVQESAKATYCMKVSDYSNIDLYFLTCQVQIYEKHARRLLFTPIPTYSYTFSAAVEDDTAFKLSPDTNMDNFVQSLTEEIEMMSQETDFKTASIESKPDLVTTFEDNSGENEPEESTAHASTASALVITSLLAVTAAVLA